MPVEAASKKIWTVLDLINWGTAYLTEKGFDEARLNVELLLSHVLQCSRIALYTSFDRPLNEGELGQFKEFLKRRLVHEPIQYITGYTEFMGFPFDVNPNVLIPRPETEILVEETRKLAALKYASRETITILDVGTGSGCIAVSLAKLLPNAAVTAFDISGKAVETAGLNARKNKVEERVNFQMKDLFQTDTETFKEKFDIVISNPPYISTAEFERLEPDVKNFEPAVALADNGDGLKFYRHLASIGPSLLNDGGFMAVEHAYDQSVSVQEIMGRGGFSKLTVIKDYSGHDRCIIGERA